MYIYMYIFTYIYRPDVCKGWYITKKLGGDVHVWLRSSGRITESDRRGGLKQVPVIRNREVGRIREAAFT